MTLLRISVSVFGIGAFLSTSVAAPPDWWTNDVAQTRVIVQGGMANNYAPANLGQLKFFAKQAKKHLDIQLASVGGAGQELNNLVNGFEPRTGQNYTPEQIAAFKAANYAPINLGQLKAVVKPFYTRLRTLGYQTRASLIAHGYPAAWAYDFPWNPNEVWNQAGAADKSINYLTANIGQLKMAFSFDLTAVRFDLDSDMDGLSDGYELLNGMDPLAADGSGDLDGDGVPNREDARPNDSTVGRLSVVITSPANNTNIP